MGKKWKIFFSFWMMSWKNFRYSGEKWQVCQNCILVLHKNILRKEVDMFLFFLELDRTFLQIPSKNLGQVCRNWIFGGQRSFLHKTCVSGKAKSLSWFWVRMFSVRSSVYLQKYRQFVISQKWIPSLHRNDLRTKNWKIACACFQIFGGNISKC